MVDPASSVFSKVGAKRLGTAVADSQLGSRGKDEALATVNEQIDRIKAKQRAIKFAQQTSGRLVQLQFGDGAERWVIFKGGKPIQAFPEYRGELGDALVHHTKIRTRTPSAVKATLPASKAKRTLLEARRSVPRPRVPFRKQQPQVAAEAESS